MHFSDHISLTQGDITELDCDAIVNPANQFLQHGGGVAGTIVKKGGSTIQEESNKIGGTAVGTAVITGAGRLKSRYVIHAVGPRMGEGDEETKLYNATLHALRIAEEHKLKSIAFPAISTGIFGYPIEKCAEIMLKCCRTFLEESGSSLKIVFCLWTNTDFEVFKNQLNQL